MKDDKTYYKNVAGTGSIVLGVFLIIEHLWSWGELTFWDFIGHEWLGFILILAGIILNVNWKKKNT